MKTGIVFKSTFGLNYILLLHFCYFIWTMHLVFQLELLAAKNLIAANLNGTSDPYAIITCGTEKRFRLFSCGFFSGILTFENS